MLPIYFDIFGKALVAFSGNDDTSYQYLPPVNFYEVLNKEIKKRISERYQNCSRFPGKRRRCSINKCFQPGGR